MRFDKVYNKTIEELCELATVLTQQRNKKHRNYSRHIENEIGDVYVWLDKLSKRFNQRTIHRRIVYKKYKNKL